MKKFIALAYNLAVIFNAGYALAVLWGQAPPIKNFSAGETVIFLTVCCGVLMLEIRLRELKAEIRADHYIRDHITQRRISAMRKECWQTFGGNWESQC